MKRRTFLDVSAGAAFGAAFVTHTTQAAAQGKTIPEPARNIELIDEADIVVLGGGPAGCAAATAAARSGADVLLIERYGCLGGMATDGLVILLDCYGKKGEILMSGLTVDYLDRLKELHVARTPDWFRLETPVYCPEMLKFVSLDMAEKAGVRFLLHAWAVQAYVVDDRLDAVIVESKSGRQAVRGRIFIDCTGDGDTAAWAGVPHETSESPFGNALNAQIGNVDYPRFRKFTVSNPDRWKKLREEMAEKEINFQIQAAWTDRRAWINTHFPGSAIDVRDLTYCETTMRRRYMDFYLFLRDKVPGFEDANILATASQVGTRESRRITGMYVMKDEDVPGGHFEDSIGTGVTWTGPKAGEAFDIPYRSLVPKGIGNLLYAGRCISADHEAHQNTRVITNCWAMGQGAGVGAGIALEAGCRVGEVDVKTLQSRLRSQGVEV